MKALNLVVVLASAALLTSTGSRAEGKNETKPTPAPMASSSASTSGKVAGVISAVDKGKNQLTLVVPSGTETDVTTVGKMVFVEQGMNYVSLQAPIGRSAQIYVDGKRATFSDLKEGDVVRASFDAKAPSFSDIAAVTPMQIEKDLHQARTNLDQQLSNQLDPKGMTKAPDTK